MVLTKTPICNFGEKPHSFELKDVSEKTYNFRDLVGEKGTLIMFICNHCPYVKAVIQNIVHDADKLKNLNINTVAVMSNDTKNYPDDSFENMIKFSKINKFNFPYLFDETQ
ncbi:MAG: thioredoxin family protein, partial [Candidatus Pelagibacter sp. TMED196]